MNMIEHLICKLYKACISWYILYRPHFLGLEKLVRFFFNHINGIYKNVSIIFLLIPPTYLLVS